MAESLEDVILGDRYWLARAKSMADSAITAREEAAGRIVTGVAFFWTIYSTVVVASLAVSQRASATLTIALTIPAAVMVVAYLVALIVIYPVDVQFDPRSPTDIERAYKYALQRKCQRLRAAVFCTSIAGVAVLMAILVAGLAPG
jgi:predicted histidine transporter YuiF (NhaC family)